MFGATRINKRPTRSTVFAVLMLMTLTVSIISGTSTVFADGNNDMTTANNRYYAGILLRECMRQMNKNQQMGGTINVVLTQDPATMFSGGITTGDTTYIGNNDNSVNIGQYYAPGSGNAKCHDGGTVSRAMTDFDNISADALYKLFGYVNGTATIPAGTSCNAAYSCTTSGGTVNTYTLNGKSPDFSNIDKKLSTSNYQQYFAYVSVFNKQTQCSLTAPPTGKGDAVNVRVPTAPKDQSGKWTAVDTPAEFPITSMTTPGSNSAQPATTTQVHANVAPVNNYDFDGQNTDCRGLLAKINDLSGFVVIYNTQHKDSPITAIATGAKSASTACATGSSDPNCASKTTSSCTIQGIGWVVCPVTTFLGNLADGVVEKLNDMFMVPSTQIFNTNNDTYKVWQQVRNYANILFVIVFLIIIFSQVTSFGISNYGIKKLLPKLVIVAILVNVSFPICALLVDLSNLLGYGIGKVISSAISVTPANTGQQGTAFGGIVATIIGAAAFAAAIYFALASLIGILITVVVIGVTLVVLLGIRQALIILLIVLAPLAFVAMLLPNTESLFKKWREMFQALLLIFPIASVLYAAGGLAAKVLSGSNLQIVQILAAALPTLALVAVYTVFKQAMHGLQGVGGFINNASGGLNKAGSKIKSSSDKRIEGSRYGQFRKFRQQEAKGRAAQIRGGVYKGKGGKFNPRNWNSGLNKGLNAVSGRFGSRLAASGAAEVGAQFDEYVKDARSQFESGAVSDSAIADIATGATKASEADRHAAVMHIMEKGSHDQKKAMLESTSSMGARTRTALADSYAKSGMSDLYGKGFAAKIKDGTSSGDLQEALLSNLGSVSSQTVAGNKNYAEDVKAAIDSTASGSPERQAAKKAFESIIGGVDTDKTLAGRSAGDALAVLEGTRTALGIPRPATPPAPSTTAPPAATPAPAATPTLPTPPAGTAGP